MDFRKPTPQEENIIRKKMQLSPSAVIYVKPTDKPDELLVHSETYGYERSKGYNNRPGKNHG